MPAADELSRIKAQLETAQAQLIQERYSHELTKVKGDLELITSQQNTNINCVKDHETRLRFVEDNIVSLQSRYALLFGGVGLLSLIALYKSFFP